MDVSIHVVLGFLFSVLCFAIFPQIGLIGFSLIFLSSVLIDIDHYLYYVYKKKNLSLKKAYGWCVKKRDIYLSLPPEKRKKTFAGFYFLHGFEILILFFLLSYFFKPSIFIFLGLSFHLLLDLVYQSIFLHTSNRIFLVRDYFRYKNSEKL